MGCCPPASCGLLSACYPWRWACGVLPAWYPWRRACVYCVIQFTSFSRTVSNHNSFQLNQILYLPSVNIYHLNLPGPLTNWLTYFRFWLRFRRVVQIFRGIILRLSQYPRSLILQGVTKDPSHFLKLLHRPLK